MPSNRLRTLFFSVLALVCLAGPAVAQTPLAEKPVTIAILPFEVNAGQDLAYLQDSLPNLLADRLKSAGLNVVPADRVTAAMQGKRQGFPDDAKAREIALLTGAGYALIGSFNQLGELLSLDARLVDAFNLKETQPIQVSRQGLINLLPAVDALVTQVQAGVLGSQTVVDIAVEGTHTLDKEVVLLHLRTAKGETFSPATVNADIKNIYDLGYFDDVMAKVADVPGGKKITMVVSEKPRIQAISVEGNDKFDDDEVLDHISSKTGAVLNAKVLKDDLALIRALYRKDGYYKTQVRYDVEGGDTGQARLIFKIEEGPKLYIKKIVLDGVKQMDPDELRDQLSLSEEGIFSWITSSGVLNEEYLERDASALTAYYVNHGFLKVKVARPEVDIRDDGIYIIFRIEEGIRYQVDGVRFEGELIASTEELLAVTKMDELAAAHDYFKAEEAHNDTDRLSHFYNDKGYAYADVSMMFDEHLEQESLTVVYKIAKHQRVHVRRVLLEGNSRTRDSVILREVALNDGDLFNGSELQRSVDHLNKLDYFETVNIEPVPTGDPNEMDLKVSVKEKPTGTIAGGVGYSSYGGAYFTGAVTEQNLFGKGYILSFNGILGEDTTSFLADFVNPHVNDSEWALGIGANNVKEKITDYKRDSYGGNIRVGHPLGKHSSYRISYYLTHYTTYDVEADAARVIKEEEGDRVSSNVTFEVLRDTVRKEGMMPISGDSEEFTVSYGGGVLLGDDSFVRYVGAADWYHNLFGDVVFHVRGSAGFVHENFDGDRIPLSQRFYLGGINSVRGYSNYYLSPRDYDSDDPIGGNKMAYVNLELLTPISKNMGLVNVIFFDAGNAWDEGEAFFSTQDTPDGFDSPALGLYKSIGTGIRWMSPFGPIRVEYGYGLDELEGSKRHKVEFSMGKLF